MRTVQFEPTNGVEDIVKKLSFASRKASATELLPLDVLLRHRFCAAAIRNRDATLETIKPRVPG